MLRLRNFVSASSSSQQHTSPSSPNMPKKNHALSPWERDELQRLDQFKIVQNSNSLFLSFVSSGFLFLVLVLLTNSKSLR